MLEHLFFLWYPNIGNGDTQVKENKAYKFRIYPNTLQQEMFSKTFGAARFVYNKMLEDKIAYYEETGKMLKATPAQYKKEYEFLKEVDSLALSNAQLQLETATDIQHPCLISLEKQKRNLPKNRESSHIW